MPKLSIPVSGSDHYQGAVDAPVTLVEYGDYECPHCGAAYPILKDVQARLGDNLKFVFRNFPINSIHENAELAAEAAEAAGEFGKFWEMHDALYENQDALSPETIMALAEEVGINLKSFEKLLTSRKFQPKVKADFMGGVKSGINGTPSFFINGIKYEGAWDGESLVSAIQEQL